MRLIDADALCEEFRMRQKSALNWKEGATLANNEESIIRADATLAFLTEVKLTIENAPTVEVGYLTNCVNCEHIEKIRAKNARPQGKWINQSQGAKYPCECSECHTEPFCNDYGYVLSNFCSNCGAEMRGGKNETD